MKGVFERPKLEARDASDELVGKAEALKAGSNVTLTRVGRNIVIASSAGGGGSPLTVQEEDGTPSDTDVTIIRVPNGTLTDNGVGDVSLGYATPAQLTAHEGAADPHTGYRLESADHSHQSTGAQAGKIDHGLALDGLGDDDHTQYLLRSILTTRGDLYRRGAAAIERVALGASGTVFRSDGTDPGWTQLYSLHTYVFLPDAAQGDNIATGDAQGVLHHSLDAAETVVAIITEAEVAPTGATWNVQLEYGDTDDLDTVSGWTEIDAIAHTAGAKTIRTTAGFTNATIPANRLIRMNIDQVGSTIAGQDGAIHLVVKRPLST